MLAAVCLLIAVSTVHADSLRDEILNKLNQLNVQSSDANEANESSESATMSGDASVSEQVNGSATVSEDSSSGNTKLIQLESETEMDQEVDESMFVHQLSLKEIKSQTEFAMTLSSRDQSKVSFDCWTRDENTCATKNCVWVQGVCSISPAAYSLVCGFYCEKEYCIEPLAGNSPETPCVPKPKTYESLCPAIKYKELCNDQYGLCTWNAKKATCAPAPTCCSKARNYCSKRKNALLNPAVSACQKFTNKGGLCVFSSANCNANTSVVV